MDQSENQIRKYTETVDQLLEGVNEFIQVLEAQSGTEEIIADLQASIPLIDQLKGWSSSLPPDRFRTTLLSLIKGLDSIILKAVKSKLVSPETYGATEEFPSASFIMDAVTIVGPEITISKDRLSVTLALPEDFKHLWSPDRIRAGLERQGIVFGLIDKKIEQVSKKKPGTVVKVAQGDEPVSGQDAVLEECLGLCDFSGKPTLMKGDRVDYKRLNTFINVSKGQVVIKKTPATNGNPGMDVFGNSIPCRDGVDYPFPPIENTNASEDGLALLSAVDGCAYLEGDKIAIVPTLEIKSNVDYSTGNVEATVAVTVEGDVLSGFQVESLEDVIVKGTVEASTIKSNGHVFLPGGVQGKEGARVAARKNIDAKFLNAANLRAKKDVKVHGFVIQCHIKARRLHLDGKEAELIGGEIEVEDDVCAVRIGSDMGVKTKIRLGYDITEGQQLIEKLEEEIAPLREKIERYTESIETLNRYKEKKGYLPPDKEEAFKKIEKNLSKAKEGLAKKEEKFEKAKADLKTSEMRSRTVRATDTIMPGVEITMMGQTLTIKKPTGPANVCFVNDALEIFPYQDRSFDDEEEME